jgi:hypothetical protein
MPDDESEAQALPPPEPHRLGSKMGRPPKVFNRKMGDQILGQWCTSPLTLEQVIEGIRKINPKCPSLRVFYCWTEDDRDFSQAYARAKRFRAHYLSEKGWEEARTPRMGQITKKVSKDGVVTVEVRVEDNVARSRLIYDAAMKRAAQLFAKEYRERTNDVPETGPNEQIEALQKALLEGAAEEPVDVEMPGEPKPPSPDDETPKS